MRNCWALLLLLLLVPQSFVCVYAATTDPAEGKKIIIWARAGGSGGQPSPGEMKYLSDSCHNPHDPHPRLCPAEPAVSP